MLHVESTLSDVMPFLFKQFLATAAQAIRSELDLSYLIRFHLHRLAGYLQGQDLNTR